jgi:hypothetical protein
MDENRTAGADDSRRAADGYVCVCCHGAQTKMAEPARVPAGFRGKMLDVTSAFHPKWAEGGTIRAAVISSKRCRCGRNSDQ